MNRRRLIRRIKLTFHLLVIVLIVASVGFGFSAWDFFLDSQRSEVVEQTHPALSCDKRLWKARWDCRKLLVDNHYEAWKSSKGTILAYCDAIATDMYCEPIKDTNEVR